MSVLLSFASGSFVHGYLITFVSIVQNLLKYFWLTRRCARYFTGRNLDTYAEVVTFSESKDDVIL